MTVLAAAGQARDSVADLLGRWLETPAPSAARQLARLAIETAPRGRVRNPWLAARPAAAEVLAFLRDPRVERHLEDAFFAAAAATAAEGEVEVEEMSAAVDAVARLRRS